MEEVKKTSAGQGLGIAGFILGIISLIVALIPCIGMLALILSITGIVLSAIALSQATKNNGPKGLIMAALSISILSTLFAVSYNAFLVDRIKHGSHQIEKALNDEFGKDADKAAGEMGKGMEDALKDLEAGTAADSISDKDFDKLISEYQDLTKQYLKLVEKAQKGDVSSLTESAQIATKAVNLAAKLSVASTRFSDEQKKKFEEIQKQYEEAVQKSEKK